LKNALIAFKLLIAFEKTKASSSMLCEHVGSYY